MEMSNESAVPKDAKLQCHQVLPTHGGDVSCIDFNGLILATGCSDKILRLFLLKSKEDSFKFTKWHEIKAHEYNITCLSFNGILLASGSYDGTIFVWKFMDLNMPQKISTFCNSTNLKALHFGPRVDQLCAGGEKNGSALLTIWGGIGTSSITNLKQIVMDDYINAAVFAPDGKFIVVGNSDGTLYVWEATIISECLLKSVKNAHDLGVNCLDIKKVPSCVESCSEYVLATGGNDDKVKMWNVTYSSKTFHMSDPIILSGHSSSVYAVKFQSDAQILVSSGNDHKVVIWNPVFGNLLYCLEAHERAAVTACFVDNAFLATGSLDKTVMIWTTNNGPLFSEKVEPVIRYANKDVLNWGPLQVSFWVQEIGLPKYSELFVEHDIDGRTLLHLTTESLRDQLGIRSLGHCLKIIHEAKMLLTPAMERIRTAAWTSDSSPEEFLCPITRTVMIDPVVCDDGNSYERSAILHWFSTSTEPRSPLTNEVISSKVVANRALQSIIQRFR